MNYNKKVLLNLLRIICLLFPFSSIAQIQIGQTILRDTNINWFGYDIDLSNDGTTLVIGCPKCQTQVEEGGLGKVFQLQGDTWVQLGSDILGNIPGGYLGEAVCISGDGTRIAIGARRAKINNLIWAGLVNIYDFNGTNWIQVGDSLVGKRSNDFFGAGLAISNNGNRIAIGSPYIFDQDNGSDGAVRVYDFEENNWKQKSPTIYNTSVPQFGLKLSLSGDGNYLAVRVNDEFINLKGSVHTFYDSGQSWDILTVPIEVNLEPSINSKATALSDDGSRLIIGEHRTGQNSPGKTRVFDFINSVWSQTGATIYGEAVNNYDGFAVDISGNGSRIAIGTIYNNNDSFSNGPGRIRVFELNINNNWSQMGENIYGNMDGEDLGYVVALSQDGSVLATSAPVFTFNSSPPPIDYVKVYGDFISSQSNIPILESLISIFPNPASTYFQVNNSTLQSIDNISIFDIQGKKILNDVRNKNVNISHLSPGIYLVNIKTTDQQMHTEKLLIQR